MASTTFASAAVPMESLKIKARSPFSTGRGTTLREGEPTGDEGSDLWADLGRLFGRRFSAADADAEGSIRSTLMTEKASSIAGAAATVVEGKSRASGEDFGLRPLFRLAPPIVRRISRVSLMSPEV